MDVLLLVGIPLVWLLVGMCVGGLIGAGIAWWLQCWHWPDLVLCAVVDGVTDALAKHRQ